MNKNKLKDVVVNMSAKTRRITAATMLIALATVASGTQAYAGWGCYWGNCGPYKATNLKCDSSAIAAPRYTLSFSPLEVRSVNANATQWVASIPLFWKWDGVERTWKFLRYGSKWATGRASHTQPAVLSLSSYMTDTSGYYASTVWTLWATGGRWNGAAYDLPRADYSKNPIGQPPPYYCSFFNRGGAAVEAGAGAANQDAVGHVIEASDAFTLATLQVFNEQPPPVPCEPEAATCDEDPGLPANLAPGYRVLIPIVRR